MCVSEAVCGLDMESLTISVLSWGCVGQSPTCKAPAPSVLTCLPGVTPRKAAVYVMQKLGPWKNRGSILEIAKSSESSSSSPCPTLGVTTVAFLAGSYLLLAYLIVQLQKCTISSCNLCLCGCAPGCGGGGWLQEEG